MEGRVERVTTGSSAPAIQIYTKKWCGFCSAAKRLFRDLDLDFEEIPVDRDPELRWRVATEAGNWPTVPMIFIGDHFVGGFTEAADLHRKGRLLPLCRLEPATGPES